MKVSCNLLFLFFRRYLLWQLIIIIKNQVLL
nr:MAG TPA: hypothetical protein [Caudoviricetes sp.]